MCGGLGKAVGSLNSDNRQEKKNYENWVLDKFFFVYNITQLLRIFHTFDT